MIKNLPANVREIRDMGSTPGSGRSSGGGYGNPTQYPCLENPHGQRSLTERRSHKGSPGILEWVAYLFSSGSSQPRNRTSVSCIAGGEPRSPTLQADSLPAEPQGKPKDNGVGTQSLLHQIFPTQESNQGLLHCRQILYQLSYQGSALSTGIVLTHSSF